MKKYFFIFLLLASFLSCSKEESDSADIIEFSIIQASANNFNYSKTFIDSENNKVYSFIDNSLKSENFPITVNFKAKLSDGASILGLENEEIIFNSSNEVKKIEIIAEDGTIKEWHFFLIHKQIQNSKFEEWYTSLGMNGKEFLEIGNSAITSLWATANMGTSMYSVYGTQPLNMNNNQMVEITTGETKNIPVTSATLFTGKFNITGAIANPTEPRKATSFGIPFIFKPKTLKIKYKYKAGNKLIQATLNNQSNIFSGFSIKEIEGEDKCTIYAILEKRENKINTEIAKAELISGTTNEELTETLIPFKYISDDTPTHIIIVFSSSKDGDLWKGAVGSTLTIDDLELIYE